MSFISRIVLFLLLCVYCKQNVFSQIPSASDFNCNYIDLTQALTKSSLIPPETALQIAYAARMAEKDSLSLAYLRKASRTSEDKHLSYYAMIYAFGSEYITFDIDSMAAEIRKDLGNHDLLHLLYSLRESLSNAHSLHAKSDSLLLAHLELIEKETDYYREMSYGYTVLSRSYARKGKLRSALKYSQLAIALAKLHDAECSRLLAMGEFSLARRYLDLNRPDSAIRRLEISLVTFRRIIPQDIKAITQVTLALQEAYKAKFDNTSALRYLDTTEIYARLDSAVWLNMFPRIQNRRGNIFAALGNYSKARYYLLESLKHSENSPNKNQVIASFTNLASQLIVLEDYDAAKNYLTKALDLCTTSLGQNHIYTAIILMKLADTEYYLENDSIALDYYARSLQVRKNIFGEHHSYVANVYVNLHVFHRDHGEHDLALSYIDRAIDAYDKSFGSTGHQLASAYDRRALQHLIMEKPEFAIADIKSGF